MNDGAFIVYSTSFPGGSNGKESTCNAEDLAGFSPWIGNIPWRREQLPISVFWPGEFHGQRSLEGYSPWGGKELDMTERLSLSTSLKGWGYAGASS